MSFDFGSVMHDQLVLRRDRVKKAISSAGPEPELNALLREVDRALERFDSGSYAATGLPLGMFADQKFGVKSVKLNNSDALLLYTDGVLEAQNGSGEEYGIPRLMEVAAASRCMPPDKLVARCLADVSGFRKSGNAFDDITVMGIRRAP